MSLVKTVSCSHGDAETQSDMVNSLRSLRTLREPYFAMSPATSTVTLNLFQGLTSSASSRIKMLKQVQHDEVGEVR